MLDDSLQSFEGERSWSEGYAFTGRDGKRALWDFAEHRADSGGAAGEELWGSGEGQE